MSLAQIEEQIAQLSRDELIQLQRAIGRKLARPERVVTTEMLERRRQVADKFMSGEYGTDLPSWQETRALEKEKDPWNT